MGLLHAPEKGACACARLHVGSRAPRKCKEKLGALRDHYEADRDGDADGMNEGIRLSDHIRPLSELVAAPYGTTVEDLLDQVESMIEAAMDSHVAEYHTPVGSSRARRR